MSAAPTKQRLVYETLRAGIIGGELEPGQVLVIDALARRFEVSIIPVREALRQLQSERLVEIRPHTGVRVAGGGGFGVDGDFLPAGCPGDCHGAAGAAGDGAGMPR